MKKRKTKEPEWKYWGRWNQVMMFTSPWIEFSQTTAFREMDLDFKKRLKVLHGNYYFDKEDQDKLRKIVWNKIEKNPAWFEKFFSICDRKTKEMLALENKKDLKRFVVEMVNYLGCSALVEFIDFCIEDYLKEKCKKENLSFSEVTAAIKPHKKTLLMEYYDKLKTLKKKDIKKFVKEFEWVGTHAFEGMPLTEKKVFEELKTVNKKKKLNVSAKHFKEIVEIGSKLSFYRSNLMECIDKVEYGYWKEFEKLGKKHNLKLFDVFSLTHNELVDLIEKGTIPKNLPKRKKEFGVTCIDGKFRILLGKELKKELARHEEKIESGINFVEGTIAFKGRAVGKARVLKEASDAEKVKEGDILIANETTPDFVSAMGKAAAFVTDIGGITSHAAIISREMEKPCIIGTKIATKIFKDDDYVFVDADKGVVKKLTEKEYLEMKFLVKEEKEAEHKEHAIVKEEIGDIPRRPENILWFKDIFKFDIPIVGGKGANLGEMYERFPIPNGFCITVNAYEQFLEENNLSKRIFPLLKNLDIEDTKKLDSTAKNIQQMIIKGKMNNELQKEIRQHYKEINGYVAVRSSATAEDLPTASFAGQQATFLNTKGEEHVLKAVKECWASLFTSRAIYYRVVNAFDHELVLISVVVQEMIDSEKAGVMFTVNPVSKNADEMIIEGSFGLGEMVVSGQVTPDSYIVSKKSMKTIMKNIGDKKQAMIRKDGKNKIIMLSEHESKKQVLSEHEINELAKYGKAIQEHYKHPQDIEWAVHKGKIYILQSRPITTL